MHSSKRALVVGLGVAGMSSAAALTDAGWEVVIIERSLSRRTGGYFVGLFPDGAEAARVLGASDEIVTRTPEDLVTWEVDAAGQRTRGVSFSEQPGNPASLLRGDIEQGLWARVDGRCDVRFGMVPRLIAQSADAAVVTIRSTLTGIDTTERFDLVVGADGVRSTVRLLAFGMHEQQLVSFGAIACAFQAQAPLPGLQQHEGAVVAEAKRSLWVFPLHDTTASVLFTFRTKDPAGVLNRPADEVLRETYRGAAGGELLDAALAEAERAPHKLFDAVQGVRMDSWHRGRVVLVGDSAWCLTLYSGMGASAGLIGGVRLAQALTDHDGDLNAGLSAYEQELRGLITTHRRLAYLKRELFVPGGPVRAGIRRAALARRASRRTRSPQVSEDPASPTADIRR